MPNIRMYHKCLNPYYCLSSVENCHLMLMAVAARAPCTDIFHEKLHSCGFAGWR
jgi:hypothetical protein